MRKDLQMEAGKLASQAAHAARLSLLRYIKQHPERLDEFLELNACGSIAVLKAKNLGQLERAFREAQAIEGMPVSMFSDSDHIPLIRVPDPENPGKTIQVPSPHFDGSPVVTGICIGPCLPAEVEHIKKRYNCV